VLICWEHMGLTEIAAALGAEKYGPESGWRGPVEYPDERFDLIWVVPPPYSQISRVEGEQVPVLDDGKSTRQEGAWRRIPSSVLFLIGGGVVLVMIGVMVGAMYYYGFFHAEDLEEEEEEEATDDV
jgi:hypothetical protein